MEENKKYNLLRDLLKFAVKKKNGDLDKFTEKIKYSEQFKGKAKDDETKIRTAYNQAWDARKFEIDNYWKRTTYFWAFQVSSFAGYFAVISSDNYNFDPPKNPEILFCIIAIGALTALAWSLINIGSKFWQRHWEKHIDMLEDDITGPLYKTVFAYKSTRTFSVSKINSIVSRFFVVIWFVLGIKYVVDHLIVKDGEFAWVEFFVFLFIIYFVLAMFLGYGRGDFKASGFNFYKRKVFKN